VYSEVTVIVVHGSKLIQML